jgi:hypothetical protein
MRENDGSPSYEGHAVCCNDIKHNFTDLATFSAQFSFVDND